MRKIYKVALASSGERNVFDLYLPRIFLMIVEMCHWIARQFHTVRLIFHTLSK